MKVNLKCSAGVIFLLLAFVLSGCVSQNKRAANSRNVRFEHIALNVQDPVVVADWYCTYLDMRIQRKCDAPFNTRFVSDKKGNMMFEFYHNADASVPDYFKVEPGTMHIAFMVEDVESLFERLQRGGATVEQRPQQISTGDTIGMLRDPWGVPIQILKRSDPMLGNK